MAIDNIPTGHTLKQAFELDIYTPDGVPRPFGSLFQHHDTDDKAATTANNVLVVFIRHFFCGNCQEYIRRLSSPASPFHPTRRRVHLDFSKPNTHPPPSVVVIGPGSPSLLSSYAALTQCAYPVYADPSTQLYDMLGMHKTLSMGDKQPEYIQHNLVSGAVKSAWQIVKRVGNGDALDGGDWYVNGGEFLFVYRDGGSSMNQSISKVMHKLGSSSNSSPPRPGSRTRSSSRETSHAAGSSSSSLSSSSSSSRSKPGWEVRWCHRMLNSRDHTELQDLFHNTCSSSALSLPRIGSRTASPAPLRSIPVNGGNAGPSTTTTTTTQLRNPRSRSRSSARSLSRSYSSERLGACPGPDIPKSRDEALLNQALYASASARPGSKASLHRPRSRSASRSSSHDKHQRSKSVVSLTRAEGDFGEDVPGPRKSSSLGRSLSLGWASKVGMLGRSKSLSAKARDHHPRMTRMDGDDDDARAEVTNDASGEGVTAGGSASTSPNGRKRSLSSLVRRSASKKNKTTTPVVSQVRPQTATPTRSSSQTQIRPQTATLTQDQRQTFTQPSSSTHYRPDSAVSLSATRHARHHHYKIEKDEDSKEKKPGLPSSSGHARLFSDQTKRRTLSFSPHPSGTTTTTTTLSQPSRRASFTLSRRPKLPSSSSSSSRSTNNHKTSKGASTISMDENGIMLVDGVEFVNVISLKARVDDDDDDDESRRSRRRQDQSKKTRNQNQNQNQDQTRTQIKTPGHISTQSQTQPHKQQQQQQQQDQHHDQTHRIHPRTLPHSHTRHPCNQLHVHDRMAGSVRPVSSTTMMAPLGSTGSTTAAISVQA